MTEWGDHNGRWAVLELMGHRRLAGVVKEVEVAGQPFIRIDVLGNIGGKLNVDSPDASQYYSAGAIYCITPCTEEVARAVAALTGHTPALELSLPAPRVVHEAVPRCLTCSHEKDVHSDALGGLAPRRCLVEGCRCIALTLSDPNEIPF